MDGIKLKVLLLGWNRSDLAAGEQPEQSCGKNQNFDEIERKSLRNPMEGRRIVAIVERSLRNLYSGPVSVISGRVCEQSRPLEMPIAT